VQNAIDAQVKHYVHKDVRYARKIDNLRSQTQRKLDQAEMRRNIHQQEKRHKAKEAQEKFLIKEIALRKRMQRSASMAQALKFYEEQKALFDQPNSKMMKNWDGENKSVDHKKAVSFWVDRFESNDDQIDSSAQLQKPN